MPIDMYEINDSAGYIRSVINDVPEISMVLGSGLGPIADGIEDPVSIWYDDIPGFPKVTIPGHEGRLIFGKLEGRKILAMKGRFHYYEGHDISRVVFPIRVFKKLGMNDLVITNAAGGVNTGFTPGDLMIVTDHIGFNCPSPLRGENIPELGARFPDMTHCYDPDMVKYALRCADTAGIKVKTGIYAYTKGPMFETPAEIRAIRKMGADAVGMSTVPEAITARHMGMRILAVSCITNMAAGILEQPLTHEEVMETARSVERSFSGYIREIIRGWGGSLV